MSRRRRERVQMARATTTLALTLLTLATSSIQVVAQNDTLSGSLVDRSGAPVAGATLVIPGTLFGIISGADGTFQFRRIRPGEYDILITHPDYASQSLRVAVPSSSPLSITLLPVLADLSLIAIDPLHSAKSEFRRSVGRYRSPRDIREGRLVNSKLSSPIFDWTQIRPPGIYTLHGFQLTDFRGQAEAASSQQNGQHVLEAFTQGLPFFDQRSVYFFDSFEPIEIEPVFSAGYLANGGGPAIAGNVGAATSRMSAEAGVSMDLFSTDYSAGNGLSLRSGGTRVSGEGRAIGRLGSQTGLSAGVLHSSATGVNYPLQEGRLESDSDTRLKIGLRSKMNTLLRFASADMSFHRSNTDWIFPNFELGDPGLIERYTANGLRGSGSLGIGSHLTLTAESYYRDVEAVSQTAAIDPGDQDVLVDATESAAMISTQVAPEVNRLKFLIKTGFGLTQAGSNTGGQSKNIRTATLDLSFGVSADISSNWSAVGSTSFKRLPASAEILNANGLRSNFGQLRISFVGNRDLDSQSLLSLSTGVFGMTRLAEIEASSAVTVVQDGFTLLREQSANEFNVVPADLVYADVYVRSTSSFRDVASFEIDARGSFGRDRTNNEPAIGVAPWAIGSHLVMRTPSGRTYTRASTVSYLRKSSVNRRLGEVETPGAFIVDLSAGFSRNEITYELFVRNVFDKTFWYHTGPATYVDSRRIPGRGRNIGFQITLRPGQ
ncbi:MAG: TonB-dependent receptor [Rhodothermales bacterium]|nr:TonB-dependent receptor [Rhodothermales bacterium]